MICIYKTNKYYKKKMIHNTKKVIIQNTWAEGDDNELLEYCKKHNTQIMTKHEIYDLEISEDL